MSHIDQTFPVLERILCDIPVTLLFGNVREELRHLALCLLGRPNLLHLRLVLGGLVILRNGGHGDEERTWIAQRCLCPVADDLAHAVEGARWGVASHAHYVRNDLVAVLRKTKLQATLFYAHHRVGGHNLVPDKTTIVVVQPGGLGNQ